MAAIEEYTLEEVMQKIEDALNQNPGPIEGLNAIYEYDITDEDETIYQMKINDGKASVTKGADAQADCTLKLSLKDFHKLLLVRKTEWNNGIYVWKIKNKRGYWQSYEN